LIFLVDSIGNLQWSRTIENATSIFPTTLTDFILNDNGNFVILGTCVGPYQDLFLMEISNNGQYVNFKAFHNNSEQTTGRLVLEPNGGYIFSGRAIVNGIPQNLLLAKCDSAPNPIWAKKISNLTDQFSQGLVLDSTGGILAAGRHSLLPGLDSSFLLKTDMLANVVWCKNYAFNGEYHLLNLIKADLNQIKLCGYFETITLTSKIFFMNTDNAGSQDCRSENMVAYSYNSTLSASSAIITNQPFQLDENILFINAFNAIMSEDYYCSILDANTISRQEFDFLMFPNPCLSICTFQFNETTKPEFNLKLFNMMGNLIFESKILSSEFKLDLSEYREGIYIVYVSSEKNYLRKILQKSKQN
jgi:hypothetical protein